MTRVEGFCPFSTHRATYLKPGAAVGYRQTCKFREARAASWFGITLMALLLASAGYPDRMSPYGTFLAPRSSGSVFIAYFAAFLIGEPVGGHWGH